MYAFAVADLVNMRALQERIIEESADTAVEDEELAIPEPSLKFRGIIWIIETLNQRLADVDAAISNVMKGGQIIQTRNGKVQQASLSELRPSVLRWSSR